MFNGGYDERAHDAIVQPYGVAGVDRDDRVRARAMYDNLPEAMRTLNGVVEVPIFDLESALTDRINAALATELPRATGSSPPTSTSTSASTSTSTSTADMVTLCLRQLRNAPMTTPRSVCRGACNPGEKWFLLTALVAIAAIVIAMRG
jgi:hypothetical protein